MHLCTGWLWIIDFENEDTPKGLLYGCNESRWFVASVEQK